MKQEKLIAKDGMIFTNGEIYGKEIFLGEGVNVDDFHEITQEEYEEIITITEQENI